MNIDWSEAPEGATHYDTRYFLFCNKNGFWNKSGIWIKDGEQLEWATSRYIERPVTWNGEGLPPVGAAVEAKCTAKTKARDWFAAEVLYVSPYTVVLKDYSTEALDGEFVAHPATLVLQPRRTPEQIAAEEREAAIQQMIADTNILTGIMSDRRIMAGQLYDAGYRKQVTP